MIADNNKIFDKIWKQAQPYGLCFISSNGGTGKTTYFKFRFLRDAVERGIHFHIFCRYGNEMEQLAHSFLDSKPSYSNRQNKLLNICAVKKVTDKFIYIIEKETGREIAQVVNVYGQDFYKKFGNTIRAKRALFDEILAEGGRYCPNELNNFNRLVFTMSRNDKYQVIGLYNNTNPNFEYFSYYKGKSYNTHVSGAGALFIYFTATQFSLNTEPKDSKSIQSIIQNTAYNDVYNNNSFTQYEAFYKPQNLKGSSVYFRLEIENRLFKIRELDGYVYIDDTNARKRSKKPLFSINGTERTKIRQLPDAARYSLSMIRDNARLKTNNINNTVFVKILAENI